MPQSTTNTGFQTVGGKPGCSNALGVLSVCLSTLRASFSDFISGFCDYIKDRVCFKPFDFSFFKAFYKNSLAFTLAETLVVMGIIGVVAALTIPNLSKNTGNAEKVAKLKKVYAELNEAQERAIAIYGPINNWFVKDNCRYGNGFDTGNMECKQRYMDRISEFMKIRKYCRNRTENCMMSKYGEWLYGGKQSNSDLNGYPSAILNGDVSMYVDVFSYPQCTGNEEEYKDECGYIVIDSDGPNKGKNVWGRDLFSFIITTNGIKARGSEANWNDSTIKSRKMFLSR